MVFLAKLNVKATKHEKELFDRISMVNRAQPLKAQWMPDIATLNYKTGLNEDSTSTRALYTIRIIPNNSEILTIY